MTHSRWHICSDAPATMDAVETRLLGAAREAIAARGAFLVVLAGGSTPRALYRRLSAADTDWGAWHVYWGDERCVPPGHGERNDGPARADWLDRVPIPREQIHPMTAELGAGAGAADYAALLADVGTFDFVLLGLGEDGHTAGLFPGHPLGTEAGTPDALPVRDAPKPPPERVTLSARRLARSRAVCFLVTGTAKREAVAKWRGGEDLPARSVVPPDGADIFIARDALPPELPG